MKAIEEILIENKFYFEHLEKVFKEESTKDLNQYECLINAIKQCAEQEAKAFAEFIRENYKSTFGVKTISKRYTNVKYTIEDLYSSPEFTEFKEARRREKG